jgi:hypothetical protein
MSARRASVLVAAALAALAAALLLPPHPGASEPSDPARADVGGPSVASPPIPHWRSDVPERRPESNPNVRGRSAPTATVTPTAAAASEPETVTRTVTARGRVVVEGERVLAGARVQLLGENGTVEAAPDASGRFEVAVPLAGVQLRAGAVVPGFAPAWAVADVPVGADVADFGEILVDLPARVRGRVRSVRGEPIAGVDVRAFEADATTSTADGQYALEGLRADADNHLIFLRGESVVWMSAPTAPGGDVEQDLVALEHGVRGRVRALDGAAGPVTVMILGRTAGLAGPAGWWFSMRSVDDEGRFAFDLVPESDRYVLATFHRWRDQRVGMLQPLEWTGERDLVLDVRSPAAAIEGEIVTAPGQPVCRVRLLHPETLEPQDAWGRHIEGQRRVRETTAGVGSRYLVGSGRAGDMLLGAMALDGRVAPAVPVRLVEGQVVPGPPIAFPAEEAVGRLVVEHRPGADDRTVIARDADTGRVVAVWTPWETSDHPAALPAGKYVVRVLGLHGDVPPRNITIVAGETLKLDERSTSQ